MEGRVPPAAAEATDDPPPPQPSQPLSSDDTKETYIVQIPRDQIYRVPPPAHAKIVESYRNPSRQREGCGGKCGLWIVVALVSLAAIVGIGVAIVHMFFTSPKTPEFSVTKVLVKNPPTSHAKHTHPTYEISLQAGNPNERMGISYKDGGKASLSFKKKKIGGGEYPSLSQEAKDSTTVRIHLAGSNGALPSEIEKSMKDTKSKTPVSLSLTIDVPVKLKSFIPKSQELTVTCDFKVSTLASGAKILSQKCDATF